MDATHVVRTDMLRRGCTLTEATLLLCGRFGLRARVVPMTDAIVRTRFTTDAGELSFQEYFVRQRLRPQLRGIAFRGVESATPSTEASTALREADLVVIGPSNPLISIAPILRVVEKELPLIGEPERRIDRSLSRQYGIDSPLEAPETLRETGIDQQKLHW